MCVSDNFDLIAHASSVYILILTPVVPLVPGAETFKLVLFAAYRLFTDCGCVLIATHVIQWNRLYACFQWKIATSCASNAATLITIASFLCLQCASIASSLSGAAAVLPNVGSADAFAVTVGNAQAWQASDLVSSTNQRQPRNNSVRAQQPMNNAYGTT
jgi:hypothetical protein